MRQLLLIIAFLTLNFNASAWWWDKEKAPEKTRIESVDLQGELLEKTAEFQLQIKAFIGYDQKSLDILKGEAALLDKSSLAGGKLSFKNGTYSIRFDKTGEKNITLHFASKVIETRGWQNLRFDIPRLSSRSLQLDFSEQFKVFVPKSIKDEKAFTEKKEHRYWLSAQSPLTVVWQKKAQKVARDLTVMCEIHHASSIGAGALKTGSTINYQIVQGELQEISITVPEKLNILKVTAPHLEEWQIEKTNGKAMLKARFSRKIDKSFKVKIESEMPLAEFPNEFQFPSLIPQNILRSYGYLLVGTDASLKINIEDTKGISQIENLSFPQELSKLNYFPQKKRFTYSFRDAQFSMKLKASAIVPSIFTDSRLIYTIRDKSLLLDNNIEIDVRDSSVREFEFTLSPGLSVLDIKSSSKVSFDQIIQDDKSSVLKVYPNKSVLGKTSLKLELEYNFAQDAKQITVPHIALKGARTERGFILLKANKGLSLKLQDQKELRQVPVNSVPIRISDAQSAWRFKNNDWQAKLDIIPRQAAVHSEVFHLFSIGENIIYGSASLSYNISGAPVDKLYVKLPEFYKNIELTGLYTPRIYDTETEGLKEIRLQRKITGNYNLLFTFDFGGELKNSQLPVGHLETVDTASETGYISISGDSSVQIMVDQLPNNLTAIDSDQLPEAYRLLHNSTILKVLKYSSAPHHTELSIQKFQQANPLSLAVEHASIETTVNESGERISTARYWIKNASHQHLAVKLPDGARLWSSSVAGKKVRCTLRDGTHLVPIPKNKDANVSIEVTLSYAEKDSALEQGKDFAIAAPKVNAQTISYEWKLKLPENTSLQDIESPMIFTQQKTQAKTKTLSDKIARSYELAFRNGSTILTFIFAVLFSALSIHLIQQSPKHKIVLLISLFIASGTSASLLLSIGGRLRIDTANQPVYNELNFNQTISSANSQASIKGLVNISNEAIQTVTMSSSSVMALIVAAVLLLAGIVLRKNILCLAATLIAYFFTKGQYIAEDIFALAISILLPIAFLRQIFGAVIKDKIPGNAVASTAAILITFISLNSSSAYADQAKFLPLSSSTIEAIHYDFIAKEKAVETTISYTLPKLFLGEKLTILKDELAIKELVYDKKELEIKIENKSYTAISLKDFSKEKSAPKLSIKALRPLNSKDGISQFTFTNPTALKVSSTFKVEGSDWQIEALQAELSKSSEETVKDKTIQIVKSWYRPNADMHFRWQKKKANDTLKVAKFFAETQSLIAVTDGVADVEHHLKLQIAHGKLSTLKMQIPKQQNVTTVNAAELRHWGFDPETRMLEMIFKQDLIDKQEIFIKTQITELKFDKKASYEIPTILKAQRQRGFIALSTQEGVKTRVVAKDKLFAIDNSDFPINAFALSNKLSKIDRLIFSFRYFDTAGKLDFQSTRILSELTTQNTSSFSIGDERFVLSSRLELNIAKSGVFSVTLQVPKDYEVESLSASQLSHWDEDPSDKGLIHVHFRNKTLGRSFINISLVKNTDKAAGQNSELAFPAIKVKGERKHTGSITVSAERGNRIDLLKHDGVSAAKLDKHGTLSLKILRPNWQVQLKREKLNPRIESESLQALYLSDKLAKVRQWFKLKVENAAIKELLIELPKGLNNLEFSGQYISRVEKIDDTKRLIIFNRKIFGNYTLKSSYQLSNTQIEELSLKAINIKDSARQQTTVAIMAPNNFDIKVAEDKESLQNFEARLLPTHLQFEDFSQASAFRKTLKKDYEVKVNIQRHQLAEALSAKVKSVTIDTISSLSGDTLNSVKIILDAGNKRFLKMTLPESGEFVSAFIDKKAVKVSVKDGQFLIPLPQEFKDSSSQTEVAVVYADTMSNGEKQAWKGPKFDLPLRDIKLNLYLPKKEDFKNFTGTLKFLQPKVQYSRSAGLFSSSSFNTKEYGKNNLKQAGQNITAAQNLLQESSELKKKGNNRQAIQKLEEAVRYSNSAFDLNEDARVQLDNLVQNQIYDGLYQQRAFLNDNLNISDFEQLQGVNKDYEREDKEMMNRISYKIMTQQRAARQEITPLLIDLPKQGYKLSFHRDIHVDKNADLSVAFSSLNPELKSSPEKSSSNIVVILLTILAGLSLCSFRKENFSFK